MNAFSMDIEKFSCITKPRPALSNLVYRLCILILNKIKNKQEHFVPSSLIIGWHYIFHLCIVCNFSSKLFFSQFI